MAVLNLSTYLGEFLLSDDSNGSTEPINVFRCLSDEK